MKSTLKIGAFSFLLLSLKIKEGDKNIFFSGSTRTYKGLNEK
jgi:hypothetical protein